MEFNMTTVIAITSLVFCIATFVVNRINDAKKDTKEDVEEKTHIEVFRIETQHIKDDLNEIKSDIKEIKRLNSVYKEEMRKIADDIAIRVYNQKIQEHIEKFHNKG